MLSSHRAWAIRLLTLCLVGKYYLTLATEEGTRVSLSQSSGAKQQTDALTDAGPRSAHLM